MLRSICVKDFVYRYILSIFMFFSPHKIAYAPSLDEWGNDLMPRESSHGGCQVPVRRVRALSAHMVKVWPGSLYRENFEASTFSQPRASQGFEAARQVITRYIAKMSMLARVCSREPRDLARPLSCDDHPAIPRKRLSISLPGMEKQCMLISITSLVFSFKCMLISILGT
jgi:hypothetical protein